MLMERGYSKPQSIRQDKLVSDSHLSAWGGRMRKYLIVMIASMCLGISLAPSARAQGVDWKAQRRQIKSQQKIEWNSLKTQQHNIKQSWKTQHTSSAQRALASHQMQRERRDLKQRQKDVMQDLRDRQKSLSSMQRANRN
jgi:hypothetical protein